MTVVLWRIATEAPAYKAVDATGTGARLSGGRSKESALLAVPSVVIPMEQNVRINPHHPEASQLVFTNTGKFLFDSRIRKR